MTVSQREGEKGEKIEESKNVQTTPPAPTASAVGPCPTVIKIVGRSGTGSLPSIIALPDHPLKIFESYTAAPAAPQSSSFHAALTEASASTQKDMAEPLSQKEKQTQDKSDKKLKQLIRETLSKPKRNTPARTTDTKQRGKEKSVPNTDRQPKGSDDPIRQHNRFSTLDMMEAEESPSCIPKGTIMHLPTS